MEITFFIKLVNNNEMNGVEFMVVLLSFESGFVMFFSQFLPTSRLQAVFMYTYRFFHLRSYEANWPGKLIHTYNAHPVKYK